MTEYEPDGYCKTCFYFIGLLREDDNDGWALGECDRFPPVYVPHHSNYSRDDAETWIHPRVSPIDFCGEYKESI
jgi:hypothetical protein